MFQDLFSCLNSLMYCIYVLQQFQKNSQKGKKTSTQFTIYSAYSLCLNKVLLYLAIICKVSLFQRLQFVSLEIVNPNLLEREMSHYLRLENHFNVSLRCYLLNKRNSDNVEKKKKGQPTAQPLPMIAVRETKQKHFQERLDHFMSPRRVFLLFTEHLQSEVTFQVHKLIGNG